MKRKVSIVVITYNGERFLREQLDSLISQTYPIYEIIVQDDGSRDGTWAILEEYAEKYPYVHIYHNEAEHGVNGNVYSAVGRATGELVAICDQDDIWEPQKIEEQVALIGDRMLIGGTTMPFSDDGSPVSCDMRRANCHVLRLIFASAIPGHSMLFRPELLRHFHQINDTCYDAQLQVVAAAMESLTYQGVCPVHQRRHNDAATFTESVDNSRNATNALRYVLNCMKVYPQARPVQKRRMRIWHGLLESVDQETASRRDAIRMTELMQRSDLMGRLRLVAFCYRNRQRLFYVEEKDSPMLKVRALLYPLTSVFYYRGLKE